MLHKYFHNLIGVPYKRRYEIEDVLSEEVKEYLIKNNYKLVNRQEFESTYLIIGDTYKNSNGELYIEYKYENR